MTMDDEPSADHLALEQENDMLIAALENSEAERTALLASRDALREALCELVAVNEQWNTDMICIIGRPPNWTDGYLNRARAALAQADAEPEASTEVKRDVLQAVLERMHAALAQADAEVPRG